jgi:hypothetical protein
VSAIINRCGADAVIRAVNRGGRIKPETAVELMRLIHEQTSHEAHLAVEINTGSMLKTIDNEDDAQETLRRLRERAAAPEPRGGQE